MSATGAAAWRVLGSKGCGSAIVEALLVMAGIPYEREELEYSTAEGRARLVAAGNVLGQVPTVILPDGTVMTETAAIAVYLDLVPKEPAALRWLIFLVAAIYPTFTYGDAPERWVTVGSADLRTSTDEHRMALWQTVDQVAQAPYFLGDRLSALDVYIAVMTRWRPRRDWFDGQCPRLYAIAERLDADPRFAAVWATNFF